MLELQVFMICAFLFVVLGIGVCIGSLLGKISINVWPWTHVIEEQQQPPQDPSQDWDSEQWKKGKPKNE